MLGTLGGNHSVVIHFLINGRQSYLLASSLGLSINVTFVVVKIISSFRFVFARQCQEFMRRRRRKRRKRISDTRRHIQEVEAEEVNWGVLASFFLFYTAFFFFFLTFLFVMSSSLCFVLLIHPNCLYLFVQHNFFSLPPVYFQHVLSLSLSLFLPSFLHIRSLKFLELQASPWYSGDITHIRCRNLKCAGLSFIAKWRGTN